MMKWESKPLQRQENSQDTVLFLARFAEPKLDAIHIFGSQNLGTDTGNIFPAHNKREHFPP